MHHLTAILTDHSVNLSRLPVPAGFAPAMPALRRFTSSRGLRPARRRGDDGIADAWHVTCWVSGRNVLRQTRRSSTRDSVAQRRAMIQVNDPLPCLEAFPCWVTPCPR